MPYHNIDDEPRADFLPLLEAHDRFGQLVGYPGVLMHYYAPSSVQHRFAGSECFFFLFDRPAEALDAAGWAQLLTQVVTRFRSRLQIKKVTTDYASYQKGERVLIRARVANLRSQAAATEVHFYAQAPGEMEFRKIVSFRRCPEGTRDAETVADFVPRGKAGFVDLRAEAWQDPDHAVGTGDCRESRCWWIAATSALWCWMDNCEPPPILSVNGPSIRLERSGRVLGWDQLLFIEFLVGLVVA